MAIKVLDHKESYRLLTDERGHYAVVEVRCGHVYSLHGHHRREAPDSQEGMAHVIGNDGWFDEAHARGCFNSAAGGETYYSQHIW